MQRQTRIIHEKKLKSLNDERIEEIIPRLNNFFNNSTQSVEILEAIFEQYYPSSSIYESIINLYLKLLNKPSINKLLDKTVEYLVLNNYENFINFNEQIENSDLLYKSILKNNENIFKLLLKCGFNPNSLLSDRKTPLSMVVVNNSILPMKRLEYIQLLFSNGANPIIRDINNVSPFERLCGMESNYPIVYTFFRDYLLSIYSDEVQYELNSGLKNALYNWCVPIVTDLLEIGAIFNPNKNVNIFLNFLMDISSTVFKERRTISFINPFILCLIQILLHDYPYENYSKIISQFIKIIYLPVIYCEINNNPLNNPSMKIFKKFLFFSFHYGFLNKQIAKEIQTNDLPKLLSTPIYNSMVTQIIRQELFQIINQYFNELIEKYHQNSISLKLLSIRKTRQSIIKLNQKNLEQLNINQNLKNLILPKD